MSVVGFSEQRSHWGKKGGVHPLHNMEQVSRFLSMTGEKCSCIVCPFFAIEAEE